MIQQWDIRRLLGSPALPPFMSREEIVKVAEDALEMISATETTMVELPRERKLAWVKLGPTAQTVARAQRIPPVFKDAVVQTLMERRKADVILECILSWRRPIVTRFEISAKGVDMRPLAEAFLKRGVFHNPMLGYESICWLSDGFPFSTYHYTSLAIYIREYGVERLSAVENLSNVLMAKVVTEGKPTIEEVITTIREELN